MDLDVQRVHSDKENAIQNVKMSTVDLICKLQPFSFPHSPTL